MSEGRYPRMPKPKDRSKGVSVTMGEVSLKPTKEALWEEEDDVYHPHAKKAPEESLLSKVSRLAGELGAGASRPWAKLLGDKDDDE